MAEKQIATCSLLGDNLLLSQTNHNQLQQCFDEISQNCYYLDAEIPILSTPPSALQFYRDFVSWNRPCLIRHAFDHWDANYKWSNAHLCKTMGDDLVTVAATPNDVHSRGGWADAVYHGQYFVLPEQRVMPFSDFIDHLECWHQHDPTNCVFTKMNSMNHSTSSLQLDGYAVVETDDERATMKKVKCKLSDDALDALDDDDNRYCSLCNEVLYCQLQNDCMTDEYRKLVDDIDLDFEWVSKALNKKPEAVNFWMGEDRSTSSLHQDPFENIYCVVAGTKIFDLYPPTDEVYLRKKPYQKAMYRMDRKDKKWSIQYHPKWEMVEWVDLLHDEAIKKKMKQCHRLRVEVHEGEMLYLPSQWFHQVKQRVDRFGRTIAVNLWYDMNYDLKWNLMRFLKATIKMDRQNENGEKGGNGVVEQGNVTLSMVDNLIESMQTL